jgi:hypothetical protein
MPSSQSSALRIFATSAAPAQPARPRVATETAAPAAPAVSLHGGELDDKLLAVLTAPASALETALACFERKERELTRLFAALSAIESRALHLRLVQPRAGDALATRFAHFTVERRVRLLTFLADARRREALRRSGRAESA